MAKSIKVNFIYNILLNVLNVLFPLITAPYVARVLLPENVGLYNFANTYAAYFALVAALGIPTYGIREVAKCRDSRNALQSLFSEIFTINVISTFFVSIIFVVSIFVVGQLHENWLFFIVAGIVVYTKPFSIEWVYQGLENFGFITIRSFIVKLLCVISLFLFVHNVEDVLIYLWISVSATILNQIWNFVVLAKSGIKVSLKFTDLGKHIRPILLLFASAIAISIYAILDTLMLGFMANYSEVAFYNNASNLSKSILAVVTSLSIVAMPRLSYYMKNQEWDEINLLIKKSMGIISFLAIPMAFGMVLAAPVFIPLFLGEAFEGAVLPLQIMAFVIVAIGFNNLTGVQVLIGLGYDKLFLYSVLSGAFLNFVLNSIFIPELGASGAALASVMAETLILFITTYFVYKKTKVRLSGGADILKSFVGGLTLFPISYILGEYIHGWLYVISLVIVGCCFYILSQFLMKSYSVELFIDIIKKKIKR